MSSSVLDIAPDDVAAALAQLKTSNMTDDKWEWREDTTLSKDSSSHSSSNFVVRSRDASGHSGPYFCSREGSMHGRASCLAGSREGSMHGRNVSSSREGSMHGRNVSFCLDDPTRSSPPHRGNSRATDRERRPSLERDAAGATRPPQLRGLMSLGRGGSHQHQVMGPPAPLPAARTSVSAPAVATKEAPKLPHLTYDAPSTPMMHLHSAPAVPAIEPLSAPPMHPQPAATAVYYSYPAMHPQPAPAIHLQPQAPAYIFTSHDLWARAMQRWQTPSASDAPAAP